MLRIIRAEFEKTWGNRTFLVLLAGLLFINVFLLWVDTDATSGSSAAYKRMNQDLAGKTMQEKADFLDAQFAQTKALYTIGEILRAEAYDGGRKNASLREEYAAEFAEYYDLYMARNYLRYMPTLQSEYRFVQSIQQECDIVAGYPTFLEKIAQNANTLKSFSIFADSTSGFDTKNIEKTAADYAGLSQITISYTPQKGLYTALDFALTDVVLVFVMLLVSTVLVRQEYDNGMYRLICTTPKGRVQTAVAKVSVLALSLLLAVLLLYGVNLIYCSAAYSLGDLGRSIQSLPAFLRSTLQLNVLQYIGLFLLIKWLAAVVVGVFVMLCMLYCRNFFCRQCGCALLFRRKPCAACACASSPQVQFVQIRKPCQPAAHQRASGRLSQSLFWG